MELSAQMEAIGAKVDLAKTPREQNMEASSWSNMVCDGFDLKHRVHIDMTTIQWKVLLGLLVHGANVSRRADRADERVVRRKRRREERLRVVEPW